MEINKTNVGRIAERIAMNEFEAHGFHIIDLAYVSKTSANVDFIASKGGESHNVQVKGMTNRSEAAWSVQYGYCDEDIIGRSCPMYNGRPDAALKATVVVLLAVRSPSSYRAIVMNVEDAEQAAQMNLSRYYRQAKLDGGVRKAGKVWIELEPRAKARKQGPEKERERTLLIKHEGAWNFSTEAVKKSSPTRPA